MHHAKPSFIQPVDLKAMVSPVIAHGFGIDCLVCLIGPLSRGQGGASRFLCVRRVYVVFLTPRSLCVNFTLPPSESLD